MANEGTCRRLPPRFDGHPTVDADGWCSEFVRRRGRLSETKLKDESCLVCRFFRLNG
jgi:hypothetical protein